MNEQFELYQYLKTFLTDHKINLFDQIASERTRHLTTVLEDLYHPHNANAVIRNCECLGIQDIHIIENRHEFIVNRDISKGSLKWLTLHQYSHKEDNTLNCIQKLKKDGYQIFATKPKGAKKELKEIALDKKTALIFGTELNGISSDAVKMADDTVRIPMHGFTESLNLSVSVALANQALRKRMVDEKIDFKLSFEEQLELKIDWALKCIPRSEIILKDYQKRRL